MKDKTKLHKRYFSLTAFCLIVLGLISAQFDTSRVIDTSYINIKNETKLPEFQDGDIIFQISQSEQCRAIQLATRSPYAHCGILFKEHGKWRAFEAIQPVQSTALETWVKRGVGGHYVVKRLKNADEILIPQNLKKLKSETKKFVGRNYDITFGWSDEEIYCSELVWKAYQRATGLEVGQLQKLRDMDLSSELVQKILRERYGNNIPLDEIVITPASIFESDMLFTVFEN